MKFLQGIRDFLGKRRYRALTDDRKHAQVANFGRARSVGLVYREKGEGFFILVKQYVKYLKAEVGIREVMAMAYVEDHKQVPHYQLHRLRYDFFTEKELSFAMEPTGEQATRFAEKDFDILIDLEKEPPLPLKFLVRKSKARFKVGYYSAENEPLYDMLLKTGDRATFDEYVNQVNHYLQLIDTQDARA